MTTQEQIVSEIQRVLGAKFVVEKIEQLWEPHHYAVGPVAVDWLNKHCHGITTPENMATVERLTDSRCKHKGCTLHFYEHKYQSILYFHLRMNLGFQFSQTRLKAMEVVLKTNGIDGWKMTKNEYKILPRKVKP